MTVATSPAVAADADPAYTAVITRRASDIVAKIDLGNFGGKATRVTDIITRQYRDLRDIHDARDAALATAKNAAGADKAAFDSQKAAIVQAAENKVYALHFAFLARLAAELTLEQVDAVKDGLTYGVLRGTYRHYLELYPDLTDEQKRQVHAWLVEAREHAMDGGSSDEKHGWFGKYKGRINNYLSAAGYDAKEAERIWNEKQKNRPALSGR